MGCSPSSVAADQHHDSSERGKKKTTRAQALREKASPEQQQQTRGISRANTLYYSRVHEAAMQEIFKSGSGRVGLTNLGNTCYMNASIQALCHAVGLADYFLGMDWGGEINERNPVGHGGAVARAFGELLERVWQTRRRFFKTTTTLSRSLDDDDDVSRRWRVSPDDFKAVVSRCAPVFAGFEQHDAHEFLTFLLDALHEDLNRCRGKPHVEEVICDGTDQDAAAAKAWAGYLRRDRSIIVDLFQGQLRSTVKCSVCGAERVKFETFMYLSVPLVRQQDDAPLVVVHEQRTTRGGLAGGDDTSLAQKKKTVATNGAASRETSTRGTPQRRRKKKCAPASCVNGSALNLEQCIADFSAEEKLDGDNLWHCEACGKRVPATKRLELWKLPPVLIVHLKRFKFDKYGRSTKLTTHVDFPLIDLDLRPFCRSPQRDAPLYDAFAVVNHHGLFGSGHYTTHARNRVDGNWYKYNDATVTTAPAEDDVRTDDAYVLFYARVLLNGGVSGSFSETGGSDTLAAPQLSSNGNGLLSRAHTNRPTSGEPGLKPVSIVRRQSTSLPHLWPHYQDKPDDRLAAIPLRNSTSEKHAAAGVAPSPTPATKKSKTDAEKNGHHRNAPSPASSSSSAAVAPATSSNSS
mmetsp:Transcript_30703/g.93847  ORF Transcript_30703/g.93847 Transcript_30703/m.93847 type:complete len:633 (-) Transcript_30703:272-2170(-)